MLFPSLFSRLVGLILTLSSLPTAIAGGPAGVYERVGPIYQTYRIAIKTWGVNQNRILPGLTGTHPKGGANFVEMVNFLDPIGADIDQSKFSTEVGDVNDPDPHKAVEYILYQDERKFGTIALEMIFAGADTSFPAFVGRIRTVLQNAHDKMKLEDKLDDIKPFRERLTVCHKAIIELRQSDMIGGQDGKKSMVKDIKREWPGAIVKVDQLLADYNRSFRIFSLDIGTMITASPIGTFNHGDVVRWVMGYGTVVGTDTAKDHYNVIAQHEMTQTIERRHLDGIC